MPGSKIKEYGLEEEVNMLRDNGYGYHEIADTITKKHKDISLSHMAVQRYLQKAKVEKAVQNINDGKDSWEDLRADFRQKMYDLDDETREIYIIMKKALNSIIKEGNSYKTIKAAKDTLTALEQKKRNWIDLIQWGVDEMKPKKQAQQINLVKINNLLVGMSENLCPKCRATVIDMVIEPDKEE